MSRKLASIQRVWDIIPIEGADRIVIAAVLGWRCVVPKGQVDKGDLVVYYEIDSYLPVKPEYEFLRSSSYKNTPLMGEGFKIRTMKFKGQISQGLVLPLSTFGNLLDGMEVGTDVSELLGVRKWEVEERATTGGTIIGTLDYRVPKTDETRVQAQPELIQEMNKDAYYITTKMDGSSHSVLFDGNLRIFSHNCELKFDDTSSFARYLKSRELNQMIPMTADLLYPGKTVVVQGEFCAPGIQQNRLKLSKPEWYVFTLIVDGKRKPLISMIEFCRAAGLTMVPIEEYGTTFALRYPTVEDVLKRADGDYPNGGKKEGIVVRPMEPVYCDLIGDYLSFKAVSNKYLLKNED